MLIAIRVVLSLAVVMAMGCRSDHPPLRLATTTSVDNSGLLEAILPSFQQQADVEVQVVAVGSGRALQLLRRGDADVALTHDPLSEAELLKAMPGAAYRKVMFNDFVLVGPPSDEAHVKQAVTAADAMRRIAASNVAFVSRGDESGTHSRERQLWEQAGARPQSVHLLETGQGMAATLRIASERRAYTLTDRATFMQLADGLRLQPLYQQGAELLNTYAVIALAETRESAAAQFITWLSDGDGRGRISSFTIAGTHPFFVWPADIPRDTPDALPR